MPFSGLSDFIQSQRYGDGTPSSDNSDQVINQKLTKEDFNATMQNRFRELDIYSFLLSEGLIPITYCFVLQKFTVSTVTG